MDALAEEVSSIRTIQLDLRLRLDRLDLRIDSAEAAIAARRPIPEKPDPQESDGGTGSVPFDRFAGAGTDDTAKRSETACTKCGPKGDRRSAKVVPPPLPIFREPPTAPPPLPKPALPSPATAIRDESFELRFGQVWLVRIGIVVLLTGLVFLGNYAYHEFIGRIGAFGKLALLYLAAGTLSVLGWRLQRREAFRNYGRVLLGGGLATLYYATYAAHFVPTLRVIGSPLVAGTMLLALAGAFVWLADRLRSSLLAGTTIALAFYTAAINPIGNFSLFSNLVISVAGIVLLTRRQWSGVSILTLVGTYGAFAFWRLHQSGSFVAAPEPAAFLPPILFPAAYWIVHTAAVLWRRTPALDPAIRPVYLTINNAAFFALVAPVVESRHPGSLWLCALVFGLALLALGVAAARTAPDEPVFDGSYLTQGLGLLFAALIFKLTGWAQPVAFALFAGTLLGISRLRHGGIFRFFGAAAALVACVTAVTNILGDDESARTVGAACAALFVANAWMLRARKGLLKESWIDLETAGHVALAGVLILVSASFDNPSDSGLRLLGIGVGAVLSLRILRLPELAYGGQILALAGQFYLAASALGSENAHPVWPVAAAGILIVWWQRRVPLAPIAARIWQSVHCVAPVVIGLLWVGQTIAAPWQASTFAVVALAVIVAGFLLRAWPLAVAGSAFTLAAFLATGHSIVIRDPWTTELLALAILLAQSAAVTALGHRAPIHAAGMLLTVCRLLRAATSAVAVWMLLAYVPANAWLVSLTAAACALLVLAGLAKNREAAAHAAAFALIGIAAWLASGLTSYAQPIDLAAFGLLIAAQRFMRNRMDWLPAGTNASVIAATSGGLWLLAHRLLTAHESGFLITIAWSLLAFAILAAGFFWRERAYRLAGLVILTAAILRIFLVDVWELETIFRILSFLVLGVVLIALSFLYNRNAATLRKWL